MKHIIIGIDPGSKESGIVILQDGDLVKGDNITNEELFDLIDGYTTFNTEKLYFMVVYEDIRPFTSRFNMETIDTCKVIGRLEYILTQRMVSFKAITRNHVKGYVFTAHRDLILPEVEKKITARGRKKKDGSDVKPSFHYVDDRLVQKAMKVHWGIENKRGRKSYLGIKTHSWQALGAVTCYLFKPDSTFSSGTS